MSRLCRSLATGENNLVVLFPYNEKWWNGNVKSKAVITSIKLVAIVAHTIQNGETIAIHYTQNQLGQKIKYAFAPLQVATTKKVVLVIARCIIPVGKDTVTPISCWNSDQNKDISLQIIVEIYDYVQ